MERYASHHAIHAKNQVPRSIGPAHLEVLFTDGQKDSQEIYMDAIPELNDQGWHISFEILVIGISESWIVFKTWACDLMVTLQVPIIG